MTDQPVTYRPATPNDGPALDTMACKIWMETFGHSAPASDIALYVEQAYGPEGALIRGLSDPAQHYRLACAGCEIIGYVKLCPPWVDHHAVMPGAIQLSQLYVAADWHGRRIAQGLMDWTIDEARARGAPALVLTVWEENDRAKRFYDRYGFVHIGDYAFPTGTQIDRDLIMQLML